MNKYAVMPLADYFDSCEKIREKTETTNDIKSGEMPQKIDDVYGAGYNKGYADGEANGTGGNYNEGYADGKADAYAEVEPINAELEQTLYGTDTGGKSFYDKFWDAYQGYGNRTNYQYAFAGNDGGVVGSAWSDVTFKPKYDITLGAGYTGTNAFWNCQVSNLAEALESQGVKLDTSLCGFMSQMFQGAKTKRIPELNCTHAMDYNPNGLYYTFRDCSLLETIDKLIVTENLVFSTAFNACTNLKEIRFEGTIGQNGLNLQWSTKLSKNSITSIINALSTTTSGLSITLSKTAKEKAFTDTEWADLIATKSNWTINLI